MNMRLSVASMVVPVVYLMALCFQSTAVDVGMWTTSSPEAVSLSRPAVSTFNIQYQPGGYYLGGPTVPICAGGINFYARGSAMGLYGTRMTGRDSYMRYLGMNTLLEPIDSNYPGNAFAVQFLEDP